ncbi:hypothetical protein [Actinacidiphila sp. bgisy144]|uniref:hypothetical protein n=1 Tax=Actinacidiphila sp. bgisy144 TaxID=3413791 RepID=UPI003EB81C86
MRPDTPSTLEAFASILADSLPRSWTSRYHPDRGGDHDYADLTAQVWDLNEVADAMARHPVDACAVLTRDDGTRLIIIAPWSRDTAETYLIAALAPQGIPPGAFRGVREPDGISVPADPFRAADEVRENLLPRYERALAHVRTNASRGSAPTNDQEQRVVLAWSGTDLVTPDTADAAINRALTACGFMLGRAGFVLSGADTGRQSAAVLGLSQRLHHVGIGVAIRASRPRPAPDTNTVPAPTSPPTPAPHR